MDNFGRPRRERRSYIKLLIFRSSDAFLRLGKKSFRVERAEFEEMLSSWSESLLQYESFEMLSIVVTMDQTIRSTSSDS